MGLEQQHAPDRREVNSHPHSGWLDFALKGLKAKARSAWVVFCSYPPPIVDPAICGEAVVFEQTINNFLAIYSLLYYY
jgi:hypothetical protein